MLNNDKNSQKATEETTVIHPITPASTSRPTSVRFARSENGSFQVLARTLGDPISGILATARTTRHPARHLAAVRTTRCASHTPPANLQRDTTSDGCAAFLVETEPELPGTVGYIIFDRPDSRRRFDENSLRCDLRLSCHLYRSLLSLAVAHP